VVNLGTGIPTTIRELVEISAKILGVKAKIVYQPPKPGEIGNFVADLNKLKKMFGETPKTKIKGGLEKTYKWMKEHQTFHPSI